MLNSLCGFIVGLNSSPLGWVGFAAVGLDIHHGFYSLCLGCIHRVGLGPSLSCWTRRGLVGFTTVGFGICRGWVGLATSGWICRRRIVFAVVGHDLPSLGTIRRRWAQFVVVGHNSSLLGTIRRRWVAFALAALNSPVLAPLAEIGCVKFAIVDPTCRRWVQSIAVGLVGCDCDRFSLARAEELGEIEGKR